MDEPHPGEFTLSLQASSAIDRKKMKAFAPPSILSQESMDQQMVAKNL
jgi:hypothetical protein